MIATLKRNIRRILPKAAIRVPRHDRALMLRYVARSLNQKSVIVEIGAGRGGLLEVLTEYNPTIDTSLAHLIEPDPANVQILAERWPKSHRHTLAIVAYSGSITLFSMPSRTEADLAWKSGTIFREALADKFPSAKIIEIKVKGYGFDEFFEMEKLSNVDLLFLNCEGAEYEIFSTLPKHIGACRFVWIELHGNSRSLNRFIVSKTDMLDRFEAAGFTRVGGAERADLPESYTHTALLFERNDSANSSFAVVADD